MKITESGKNLISMRELTRRDIEFILDTAEKFEVVAKRREKSRILEDRLLATLFYEPSTRTQLSFQTSMYLLGGHVIGFSGTQGVSVAKGEDLSDTVRTIENYADILVIRHPLEGAPKRAAEVTSVPVINAGDGKNQHPTQILLDLYTIRRYKRKIDGLNIVLMGDLRFGRAMHSRIQALSKFQTNLFLVTPKELMVPEHIREELEEKYKVNFHQTNDLHEVIADADVLQINRIQKERFSDPELFSKLKGAYKIGVKDLKNAKEDLIILHGLPRIDEVHREVDQTPHAVYFKQPFSGLPIRMALLSILLDAAEIKARVPFLEPKIIELAKENIKCSNPTCISNVENLEAKNQVDNNQRQIIRCYYCEKPLSAEPIT